MFDPSLRLMITNSRANNKAECKSLDDLEREARERAGDSGRRIDDGFFAMMTSDAANTSRNAGVISFTDYFLSRSIHGCLASHGNCKQLGMSRGLALATDYGRPWQTADVSPLLQHECETLSS